MIDGIQPREASDRLNFFMVRFDDLWRKYVTYSGGEQLFGLEVTEYPELQRVRKELNLLQKLYGLYNDVLEKVGGYYDTPWHDIDIDVINTELIEFQNKSVASPSVVFESHYVQGPWSKQGRATADILAPIGELTYYYHRMHEVALKNVPRSQTRTPSIWRRTKYKNSITWS